MTKTLNAKCSISLSSDALKSKGLFLNKYNKLRILLLALIRQAQVEGPLAKKGDLLRETEPYKFPSEEFQ